MVVTTPNTEKQSVMKKAIFFLAGRAALYYFIWWGFLNGLGYPVHSWKTQLVAGLLTFYTVLVERLTVRAFE
jgi:hypothetical protein